MRHIYTKPIICCLSEIQIKLVFWDFLSVIICLLFAWVIGRGRLYLLLFVILFFANLVAYPSFFPPCYTYLWLLSSG